LGLSFPYYYSYPPDTNFSRDRCLSYIGTEGRAYIIFAGSVEPFRVHHRRWWVSGKLNQGEAMTSKVDNTSKNKQDTKPLIRNAWLLALLLLILALEVVRSADDMKQMYEETSIQNVILEGKTDPKVEYISNGDPKQIIVPQELLAPRLLDDRREMARYLEEFPRDQYKIRNVPGLGTFFLDSPKDFLKDVLRKGIIWEPHIVEKLVKFVRAGSTAIDAGAHIGTHTITMAKAVGSDGRVYAFEPQKKIFRELYYNLGLNDLENVVALRYALGDKPGIIEMNPVNEGNEGGTGVGSGGDKAELRTIDSFKFRDVSVIKIDVERFEDAVLEGAKKTIMTQKPFIIVEIQGGIDFNWAIPHFRNKIVKTIQKIETMGYHVGRIGVYDYLCLPK
jgi:FkbM family methyltransferase